MAARLIAVGARLDVIACNGETPAASATRGGHPALAARLASAVAYDRRRGLRRARQWLYGKERLAATDGNYRTGNRLCYGCGRARPLRSPGATLCPRGCGRGLPGAEDEEGVHAIWFCGPRCVARTHRSHALVCVQGLKWYRSAVAARKAVAAAAEAAAAAAAAAAAEDAARAARGACGHCGATDPGPSAGKGVWCTACRVQWYCKLACCNKARKTHRVAPECVARAAARVATAAEAGEAAPPGEAVGAAVAGGCE